MGRPRRERVQEEQLQGFKHFKLLTPILERLHENACQSDRAGNRILHYDQYAALIPLYFFNPVVTSLRGIQQASELRKVQRLLGCPRAALGSLSEAARVFDADLLVGIIRELVQKLPPLHRNTPLDGQESGDRNPGTPQESGDTTQESGDTIHISGIPTESADSIPVFTERPPPGTGIRGQESDRIRGHHTHFGNPNGIRGQHTRSHRAPASTKPPPAPRVACA